MAQINIIDNMTQAELKSFISTCNIEDNNLVHTYKNETIDGDKTFIGNVTFNANTRFIQPISAVAAGAKYADLAERFLSDKKYSPGTLIQFGGKKQITVASTKCNGVISESPGYELNSESKGLPVALSGQVKVLIKGKVKKFSKIVLSDIPGVGITASKDVDIKDVIGITLQSSKNKDIKPVLCVVNINLFS